MKVSVIIPVYNAESTIIRALNSVIKQSVRPFEIIIIDDGSKDDSSSLIKTYIEENDVFNFIFLQKENGGVSSARNAGLKIFKGNYIAFLDSDDEWFHDKIEKQLSAIDKYGYDFVGGLISPSNQNSNNKLIEISLSKLIFKNYFQPSTVMFKGKIVKTVGYFDETQKYAEEGNYFMRIASLYRCGLINEQLTIYDNGKSGFGESGLSANLKEMEKGELKNLKYAYKQGYISFLRYFFAVVFSILKYVRRILIVKLRKG